MPNESPRLAQTKFYLLITALIVLSADVFGIYQDVFAKSAPSAPSTKALYAPCYPYPPDMIYPIRIGLATRVPSCHFALWANGAAFVGTTPICTLQPNVVYTVTPGRLTEYATGKVTVLPTDQRINIAASDYRVWAANRWYRGSLELAFVGNKVTVINLLDLENYLRGVVPSEMPSSWHLEALKSQAVAARSYAAVHMGDSSKWHSEGFDLVPDVRDQAYKGLGAEARSTNIAVDMTRALVLKDANKVKAGFYRATVGDAEENLNMRHKVVADSVLEGLTGVTGIVGCTVKQWDGHQNAVSVQVMGKKKTREVSGFELARRLGLSTAGILDISPAGSDWQFTYRGPGNGSRGLSQHGANTLAQHGWTFTQILAQYYQDNNGNLNFDWLDKYKVIRANYAYAKHQAALKKASAEKEEDDEDRAKE
jgi:peptidoglycan hydrolase-like amidase